ncbi:putative PAS/PAC sensor hybrid histidine kinase [Magnetofaba australis IT-1]|uniref:histidine kinase n=2 Tax=Magnetofaba TaxID=1472292 RepID=A0A1Y2K0T4_9PROT|nr:putative PAS/PAC sensor hybrid histidine kinase [Magnetofaba australis IT-1]
MVGSHVNITEWHERESSLREQEQRLQYAMLGSGDGIWDWNIASGHVYYSPRWLEMVGLDPDRTDLNDYTAWESRIHPDDRDATVAKLQKELLNGSGAYSREFRMRHAEGHWVWILTRGRVVERDIAGKPLRAVGAHSDITERKNLELALAESETRHRQLFYQNKAVELLIDPADGRVMDANQAALEFYGYSREQLQSMRIDQINTLTPQEVAEEMSAARSEERTHFFFRHRLANGEERDVEVHSGPIHTEQGDLLYSIVHDITDRRRAERSLQENRSKLAASHQRLQTILDGIDGIVLVASLRTHEVLFVNLHGRSMTPAGEPCWRLYGDSLEAAKSAGFQSNALVASRSAVTLYRNAFNQRWYAARVSVITWVDGGPARLEAATDVTMQQEMMESLRAAKLEAEAASREKSRFLAAMSHDIRTPMNAVLGMSEMLSEGELNAEQRGYVRTINHAGETLLALINDILDLSKIEAGQLQLEPEPFNLKQLASATCDILAVRAERKGLMLEQSYCDDADALFLGDAQRLRQILLNLLGNAIKFTRSGGVRLEVEHAEDAESIFHFRVIDDGPGVPLDQQEAIFEPFAQAHAKDEAGMGGSGLGLSICRHLTDMMDGHLWVVSDGQSGSVFHLALPLPHAQMHAGEQTPKIPSELVNPGRAASWSASAEALLTVLITDDSEDNRFLIRSFLKHTPHRLLEATNGEQAIQRYAEERPDVVLMDVQMPGMDGYAAATQIRELEARNEWPAARIIGLTAHAMREVQERMIQAGCDMCLTKPIRKLRLLEAITPQQTQSQPRPGGQI